MTCLSRSLQLSLSALCFTACAHAADGISEAAAPAPAKNRIDAASLNACLRRATVTCAEAAPTSTAASTAAKGQVSPVSTAFVIDSNGDFLTNNHVVSGCAGLRIRHDGAWQDAEVTAHDERNDLALLRVRSGITLPALNFRDGRGVRPADPVIVIGFPYAGLLTNDPQVTTGVVSALSGLHDDRRYVELTAPVQPGSSGGPLLDLSGNVVGVVTAKLNKFAAADWTGLPEWLGTLPENVNFALKSDNVRAFLDANGIQYGTAPSTAKRDAADVGELASKSVAMVDCR